MVIDPTLSENDVFCQLYIGENNECKRHTNNLSKCAC